jgi:eukaryotic-like serine/threonine-protein kinase
MDATEPGRLLSGRYRLTTVIGRGGMGTVWQGRDELLNRDVAVKEILWPPHFTEQEQRLACRRAVREAQMAGRLSHRNVVRIFDIVEDDGHPCIVMEYLPYRSLGELVLEDGPLPPDRAAAIGLDVLAALRAAHQEGILHRDVKPGNILICPDDRVVLTDFGIARAADSTTLTAGGTLLGSPAYIAPERARGGAGAAGAPGDLWGLGASLYAAVEGHPPFEGNGALATLTAVVADEPELASHAGPLWPVIEGLLRKDPDQRLDADTTGQLLRQVADGEPGPELEAEPGLADEADPPAPRAPGVRRRPLVVFALLVLAAAGATALALSLTGSPRPQAAASAGSTRSAGPGAASAPPTSPAAPPATSPGTSSPSSASSAAGTAGQHGSPTGQASGPGPSVVSAAVPAGYHRFTNSTGFSIGVPNGWVISHDGHYVYVTDPSDGNIFLLIDQSDSPNADPLADWEQQQANRADSYLDYHLIRLQSVSYPQAEKAADWEFTYSRDGTLVHILNRNVLANVHHAYALYWSVPESDWTADYHYFKTFAATFRPAAA